MHVAETGMGVIICHYQSSAKWMVVHMPTVHLRYVHQWGPAIYPAAHKRSTIPKKNHHGCAGHHGVDPLHSLLGCDQG